jgi:hypothetical protein
MLVKFYATQNKRSNRHNQMQLMQTWLQYYNIIATKISSTATIFHHCNMSISSTKCNKGSQRLENRCIKGMYRYHFLEWLQYIHL